jgi:hypothetical protein
MERLPSVDACRFQGLGDRGAAMMGWPIRHCKQDKSSVFPAS